MPSIEITDGQASLFSEVLAAKQRAERELRLVTLTILAGHGVGIASDIELVAVPDAKPLLVYRDVAAV